MRSIENDERSARDRDRGPIGGRSAGQSHEVSVLLRLGIAVSTILQNNSQGGRPALLRYALLSICGIDLRGGRVNSRSSCPFEPSPLIPLPCDGRGVGAIAPGCSRFLACRAGEGRGEEAIS